LEGEEAGTSSEVEAAELAEKEAAPPAADMGIGGAAAGLDSAEEEEELAESGEERDTANFEAETA
jgi:ABC-type Fe3+ transport system substrate-binding protein